MSDKACQTDTTVLLLRPDRGLREDPYLAFLRTIPEMTVGGIPDNAVGLRLMVESFRGIMLAPAVTTPENVDHLRSFLLRVDEGLPPESAVAEARELAALVFRGSPGASEPQDLTTVHYGVVPDTHGSPQAAVAEGWAAWYADRARLKDAGSIADSDLDVLMAQCQVEGLDVEEAEAAVVGLLMRSSEERLRENLARVERAEARKRTRITKVSELLPDVRGYGTTVMRARLDAKKPSRPRRRR